MTISFTSEVMSDSPGVMSDSGNKRGSDTNEDYEEDNKRKKSRFENDRVEVRLIIPSWISGSIIGKGGDNIKRLRSTYQASITLPDSRGPERLVVLTSEIDKVCDALEDIIPTLTRQLNRNSADDEHELRMLVHQGHAGKIIGKSGNTIKELREETGTHVKIYVTPCPRSTDRVVQMSGTARQISNCVNSIYKIIDGAHPKGSISSYNPDNYDLSLATKYGGYDEERGGGSGKGKQVRGGRDSSPRGGSRGDFGRGGRGPSYEERYDSRGGPSRSSGNDYRKSSGSSSGTSGLLNSSAERETSQVSIPKSMAGAILGKGGSRIKQVQQESGTKIKMDDASVDSEDRIITIIGTKEQIQYAQYLLQMMVKKYAANGGRS